MAITGALKPRGQGATAQARRMGSSASRTGPLRPSERVFLRLLAEGRAYREIASRMQISINTVRDHVRSVYRKLGVNNRTQAVVAYLRDESHRFTGDLRILSKRQRRRRNAAIT